MHVGSVMVFDPPSDGFDYDRLVQLISTRIAFVPRYRQRIRQIPGRLANPVWVDDENFDVTYHVRRSALPRPGSDEQLQEFVARIQPRALDRHRPLWEVYLVEGLAEGRFAIVTKSHQALVDGINAVDIAQVIVDGDPAAEGLAADTWRPSREPSDIELFTGALVDAVRRPSEVSRTSAAAWSTSRPSARGPLLPQAMSCRRSPARPPVRPPTRRSTRRWASPAATS